MKPSSSIVYVVDDDVSVREALASLIGSVALNVECFASPQEFLRRRNRDGPSCLVLDVRMPGLSGLDLQRELQAQGRAIPIIFATAKDEAFRLLQSEAGALAVLRKPFDPEELPRLVKVAVEARRRR